MIEYLSTTCRWGKKRGKNTWHSMELFHTMLLSNYSAARAVAYYHDEVERFRRDIAGISCLEFVQVEPAAGSFR